MKRKHPNHRNLPDAQFDTHGQYILDTHEQILGAALETLRFVIACPQAYHSQGQRAVIENMRQSASALINVLDLRYGNRKTTTRLP